MSNFSSDASAHPLPSPPPTTTTTNTPNPTEYSPPLKKPKLSAGAEKSFDGVNFTIEWSMHQDSSAYSGISNVLHYTGILKAEKPHEGDYEKEDCGEIHCTKILQTNIENDGENLYYTCDAISSELERVAHLLTANWDKTDSKFVNDAGDKWEITQGDILYVSTLKVKEEYRGMGLGLFLLDAADRQINSHMSLTLLIPFPLVYEESGVDRSNLKADMKRLAAYYKRLGFGSLGWPESAGSLFVARWNGYTSPRIETVCPVASQFY